MVKEKTKTQTIKVKLINELKKLPIEEWGINDCIESLINFTKDHIGEYRKWKKQK
jgi:hypothetical protein